MGGAAMLGLGDLVLPGLIVAFAARYDVSIGRGGALDPCLRLPRPPTPSAELDFARIDLGAPTVLATYS